MSTQILLAVGRIRKAHGIRGEVSAEYYADSPDLLQGGVFLRQNATIPAFYAISSYRVHHGSFLIRFTDIQDRSAAEQLRGCEILIPEERFPEPGDGELYLHEILGLRVIAETNDGGTEWGTIEDVSFPGGQEIWTIAKEGEEDVLFPAAPEFVLRFDLEGGFVRIAPPPGLIDLYRP